MKIKIIIISLLLNLYFLNFSYAVDDYHLVINQSNATSHAVLYRVNSSLLYSSKPELVAHTFVTNASALELFCLTANLEYEQQAISMLQFCIDKLKEEYQKISNEALNLSSVVVGIAKHNKYATTASNYNNKTKIENLHEALISSLNKNNFFCYDSRIKYIQDTTLIAKTAITIANDNNNYTTGVNKDLLSNEYDINKPGTYQEEYSDRHFYLSDDKGSWHPPKPLNSIKNVWCFFITDNSILYLASQEEEKLDNITDINDILIYKGNSYGELGRQTAKLFAHCINTESSIGKTGIQKYLSNSDLGKQLLARNNQSLAHWLQPSLTNTDEKNNTRALLLYKYISSNTYFICKNNQYYPESPLCQGHFLNDGSDSDASDSDGSDRIIKTTASIWGIRKTDGANVWVSCPKSCAMYGKTEAEIEDTIPQQTPPYAGDNLTTEQKQDIGIINESAKGGWTDDSCWMFNRKQLKIVKDNCDMLEQLMQQDSNNQLKITEDDLVVVLGDGLFINDIINGYYTGLEVSLKMRKNKCNDNNEILNRIIVANKKLFIDSIIKTAYQMTKPN